MGNQKRPFFKSSHSEVFLGKSVLKICSKFTIKHPCRSVISIKLIWNFIEITLRHGCYPVNLLHIFRTPFPKDTSERLLLFFSIWVFFHEHSRFTGQQGKGQATSLTPLSHFHQFHRHLEINWAITAETEAAARRCSVKWCF